MKTNKTTTICTCDNCGTVSDPVTFFEVIEPPPLGSFAIFRGVPPNWMISLNDYANIEYSCSEKCAIELSNKSLERINLDPRKDEVADLWNQLTNPRKSVN